MGYTHCFAVAVLNGDWSNLDPVLLRWFENAKRADAGVSPLAQVEHNVLTQVARLERLPCVRNALAERRLRVHGMVYDIGGTFVRVDEKEPGR